jgi:hypothetical protein
MAGLASLQPKSSIRREGSREQIRLRALFFGCLYASPSAALSLVYLGNRDSIVFDYLSLPGIKPEVSIYARWQPDDVVAVLAGPVVLATEGPGGLAAGLQGGHLREGVRGEGFMRRLSGKAHGTDTRTAVALALVLVAAAALYLLGLILGAWKEE